MRSLRARVILASVLWTAGLLPFAHASFFLLWHFFPSTVRHMNVHYVLPFGVLCMLGGFFVARGVLLRFTALRAGLTAVREGVERRVEGIYPTEVQPLVTELNALLEHRDEAVRRAQAKAGDLAHGLRTPLAVIAHESDRVAAAGLEEPVIVIRQQLDRMRRQIELHLAQARAGGSGATLGARSIVAESVDALIRTLQRLHAERGLTFAARVAPSHAVRVQREDLEEMLGNLLDNACKWAKSRIAIGAMTAGARVVITVDDDGPGLDPALREAVLQRGVRADEAAPGTGLGLAIVRDLAEVYGGSIALESSPLGGICARLELPAAS